MHFLAEFDPTTPAGSGVLIAGLLGLGAGYRIVLGIIKDHRELGKGKETEIKPQPLIVAAAKHFVEKEEFHGRMGALEMRVSKIEEDGEERIVELHKRLNGLDRDIGTLIGEVRLIAKQTTEAAQQAHVAAVQASAAAATAQAASQHFHAHAKV